MLLQEPVLGNIGLMYDLGYPGSSKEMRHKLSTWAIRLVPDDFDLAVNQGR